MNTTEEEEDMEEEEGMGHVEEVLDMVINTICSNNSSSITSLGTATALEEEEEEVEVDSECDRYATTWDGTDGRTHAHAELCVYK